MRDVQTRDTQLYNREKLRAIFILRPFIRSTIITNNAR